MNGEGLQLGFLGIGGGGDTVRLEKKSLEKMGGDLFWEEGFLSF